MLNKKLLFVLSFLFSLLTFSGETAATVFEPISSDQSDCKGSGLFETRDGDIDNQFYGEVSYTDGQLTLTVHNLVETCGSQLVATADVEGNEIHFTISNKGILFDCMCVYDLTCVYDGILEGTYAVFLEYDRKNPIFSKEITVTDGSRHTLNNREVVSHVSSVKDSQGLTYRDDNILEINYAGATGIEIYNTEGRLINKMTIEGPSEMTLSALPKGLYIIKAQNGSAQSTIHCLR